MTDGVFSIWLGKSPEQAIGVFTLLNGHEFCGECRICRQAQAGTHPDFVVIEDDSVDAARMMVRKAMSRPAVSKYRLILIKGPKSDEFQSTLLKFLEDPGDYTRIIWTADKRSDFLPTILSRAQVLKKIVTRLIVQDSDSYGRAVEFLDMVGKRNLIGLIGIADSWQDPHRVVIQLEKIALERLDPVLFDQCTLLKEALSHNRQAGNIIYGMVEALIAPQPPSI